MGPGRGLNNPQTPGTGDAGLGLPNQRLGMNLPSGMPGHPVRLGPGRAWSLASHCPQLTAPGPGPECGKYTIRAAPLLPGAQQSLEEDNLEDSLEEGMPAGTWSWLLRREVPAHPTPSHGSIPGGGVPSVL